MYSDMGAVVTDNKDQNLGFTTSLWIIDSLTGEDTKISDNIENIDTSIANTYIIKYNAADGAGNSALEVKRTVVVNSVEPVVSEEESTATTTETEE
jgi:hypothetical protein